MALCAGRGRDKLFLFPIQCVERGSSQRSGPPPDETCCHWESVGGVTFKHIICQRACARACVRTLTGFPRTHFGIQGQRIIVSLCVEVLHACLLVGVCITQTCPLAARACAFFLSFFFLLSLLPVLMLVVLLLAGETARHVVCKQVPETPETMCVRVPSWKGSLLTAAPVTGC